MMEAAFDLKLVEQFVASVRKMGANVLSSSHSFSETNQISTPVLTWVFSNRSALPDKDRIASIIELDIERQKNVIGYNILKEGKNRFFDKEEKLYSDATQIISEVWPDMHRLLTIIQPRISFQTEDRKEFESESDPKTFGEIIFNMQDPCPMHWAEIIVHELAHHYLTVLLGTVELSPKLKDKFKKTSYSYQRRSERPIIGILHGVFAQTCILHFATKILLSPHSEQNRVDGANKTFERFSDIFLKDLKTIKKENLLFIPELVQRTAYSQSKTEQVQLQTARTCHG